MPRLGKVLAQAIGLIEGKRELSCRNLEAHVAQIVDRSEAMVRNLIDVEGELCPDVLLLAFGIVHDIAVAFLKFWKLDRHGNIRGLRVPNRVADVMRKSTDSECELICIAGIAEEINDEITGTHVMREV